MKQLLKTALRRFGYDLVRYSADTASEPAAASDLSAQHRQIISTTKRFTMTSAERTVALIDSVMYITRNNIPGDICECGVWRGGSMMAVALTLLSSGDLSRNLYLYDTFEGMPEPSIHDRNLNGTLASEFFATDRDGAGTWCSASLEEVRSNLVSTGYPSEKIHLIKGKVQETIPRSLPTALSILRLDTDWYESTSHELRHLYPLLRPGGILVIDDYGHWQGARKAVDEYFQEHGGAFFLHRIDYTGRLLVKPAAS